MNSKWVLDGSIVEGEHAMKGIHELNLYNIQLVLYQAVGDATYQDPTCY
jgi:hypothetical protein